MTVCCPVYIVPIQSGQQAVMNFACFFIPHHTCIYNRLPEKEPSGSKHVEDIKIEDQNINL